MGAILGINAAGNGGMIGGLLGQNGGVNGTGIQGPNGAPISDPTSQAQITGAYNGTQNSLQSQQALLQALQNQNGIGNQNQVFNQLQGVASGTGPNPAQAQYQKNIQSLGGQQAGAMASIKGISPALQARLIAQQGSSAMQNAAGQGAANQAAQQLGAMGAAGNIANQQVSNQMGMTNAGTVANLTNQQQLLGAQGQYNNALVGNQGNINNNNTQLAGGIMAGQQGLIGGAMNGAGAAMGFAGGGMIPGHAGPQSVVGKHLMGMAKGGKVPALVSPGELWLSPSKVEQVESGKNPLQIGERIPGKPKVPGNSYANDTVPKKLQVGGVIIPNDIMQSKDPAKGARDMVAGIISKRKGRK